MLDEVFRIDLLSDRFKTFSNRLLDTAFRFLGFDVRMPHTEREEKTSIAEPVDTALEDSDTGLEDLDTGLEDIDTDLEDLDTGLEDSDTVQPGSWVTLQTGSLGNTFLGLEDLHSVEGVRCLESWLAEFDGGPT